MVCQVRKHIFLLVNITINEEKNIEIDKREKLQEEIK